MFLRRGLYPLLDRLSVGEVESPGAPTDQPQATSFCQAILDGELPNVIPDVAKIPEAKRLPAARFPRIRSYVSVPVTLSDGSVYGTFCAAGFTADEQLSKRDQALMEVLAAAAATVIEPSVEGRRRENEIRARLQPVISSGGPLVVLQPIVALRDGRRIGSEALSRFPAERVVVELSEHDPVHDYTELTNTLAPLRAAGMRLAIDDVGAGYSSLRHILMTSPDIVKLDRSIVAGVADDEVLRTLVASLVDFGHRCGASVVAEGIETADDTATLSEVGVDFGQGWYFGRPGAPDALLDTYPLPEPTLHSARC
ncbi:MAG: EAL domain-containing protein [Microthrixaceae bacterium]